MTILSHKMANMFGRSAVKGFSPTTAMVVLVMVFLLSLGASQGSGGQYEYLYDSGADVDLGVNDDIDTGSSLSLLPADEDSNNYISSPPLQDICSPSQKEANRGSTQSQLAKSRRIRVHFIIIFRTLTNTGFDHDEQTRLIDAIHNASTAMGAQHEFQVVIHAVDSINMRRNMRRNLQSAGFKVTGEADFAGEDEMVASEILQLLTDAPSTIFPATEFGNVEVPEATMTLVDNESNIILITCSVLGAIMCMCLLIFLYLRRVYWSPNRTVTSAGFIQPSDYKCRTVSQASLLNSISSKNYGDKEHDTVIRQFNNLGYGSN